MDNYCHGLILGYDALYKGSPALGSFYIVTDGGFQVCMGKGADSCVVPQSFVHGSCCIAP